MMKEHGFTILISISVLKVHCSRQMTGLCTARDFNLYGPDNKRLLDPVATGPVIRWEPFLHQDSAHSWSLKWYSGQEHQESKVAYGCEWGN